MLDNPALEDEQAEGTPKQETIRVGILHSLSGRQAPREVPLKEVALMTLAELNEQGGLLGRRLEPIVMDPGSKGALFADQADELFRLQRVAVIFGAWTERARLKTLPVLREHNGLMFFPGHYVGAESDYHMFYTGTVPNQRAIPVAEYLLSPLGGNNRRFMLLGTDNNYARVTNRILRRFLEEQGVPPRNIVGRYTPLGNTEYESLVAELIALDRGGPAAVVLTLRGVSNAAFFQEIARQGLVPDAVPVLSLTLDETALQGEELAPFIGHLVATNYVMSEDTPANAEFTAAFREYGKTRHVPDADALRISDPMEATYSGIMLWAQAVRQAQTIDADAVRQALAGQHWLGPAGEVRIDERNHHLHRPLYISEIRGDGQLRALWHSPLPIVPDPFSPYIPETADLVADWTYPWICGGCREPRMQGR